MPAGPTSAGVPSRRRRGVVLAVVGAVAFALAMVLLPDPAASRLYPPCPFRALTGLYCPGCGSARALYQIGHGHITAAFRLNPLMVLATPFVLAAAIGRYGGLRSRRTLSPGWTWAVLFLVVAFGILRNVPVRPFTVLAPAQVHPRRG